MGEYKVVKITPHEEYSGRTFANDIAIVEFETRVEYKKGIQPACLPSLSPQSFEPPSSKEQLVSEGVMIAGWGATGFRQPTSDRLLQGIIRCSQLLNICFFVSNASTIINTLI